MHYKFSNVNDAFQGLVRAFHYNTLTTRNEPSRVGNVERAMEPVMVTYRSPQERVLFNRARDCNPFFHLFEALWMLAGRNDVESLAYYNPRMREYSDNGRILHGAYGHRWRQAEYVIWNSGGDACAEEVDQLCIIAARLQANPTCRRQVLQIWDHDGDLGTSSKDVPCNTHVYFAINDGKLEMTVCNRSNDLIWGMLGANVVHFSFLQEYMAARIGVGMGKYHHFTNNLHVYTERWEPEKLLEEYKQRTMHSLPTLSYDGIEPFPLVKDPAVFDHEVKQFVDNTNGLFREPFLMSVAQPMCQAFAKHKEREYNAALRMVGRVAAEDWRIVGTNWIEKRARAWEEKRDASSQDVQTSTR